MIEVWHHSLVVTLGIITMPLYHFILISQNITSISIRLLEGKQMPDETVIIFYGCKSLRRMSLYIYDQHLLVRPSQQL